MVMVRQSTQAPKQVMVAEVREPVAPRALPRREPEADARQLPQETRRAVRARAPRADTEPAKKEISKDEAKRALTPAAPSTAETVQVSAAAIMAEKKAEVADASPPPGQQQQQQRQLQGLRRGALSGAPAPSAPAASPANQGAVSAENARTLFYGVPPAAGLLAEGNAMVSPKAVAPAPMKANPITLADSVAPAVHLGVRCSILRGATEADPATVLDPGEPIRLKIIPNDNGFLYVRERNSGGAWITVASGAAERFKPFETPVLRFEGSGQKELSVLFTRQRQAGQGGALPMDAIRAPRNLIQTAADQDRATYVVIGDNTGLQQVVAPITLTYR